MVTTFIYTPSVVRIDAPNFELSMVWYGILGFNVPLDTVIEVKDPQTHTQTNPQTGPITIHLHC